MNKPMNKPIIALDADGVLLDYNLGYAQAWHAFCGVYPAEKDPHAYWAIDRWDVEHLSGDKLNLFRATFNAAFWESLPALPGAIEACQSLQSAGFDLVCVSAMPAQFASARQRNLHRLGFPIDTVIATGSHHDGVSPKAQALHGLQPVAFVDDYLPYMAGLHTSIHTGLIVRNPKGSPNTGDALQRVSSTHPSLPAFSQWWLQRQGVSAASDI